ncbi:MAG: hypothetical protein D6781_07180 [Verrucomicrobia bacterium]|nr:MAG: hypothetical protein D6781_07180 [Verrucomicrobiota bacterium]
MIRTRRIAFIALLLAATAGLAQVMPNAPVVNFRFPMFNSEGYKTWELRGAEGRYINENRVELTNVNLRIYSGDETGALQTEISSPKAIIEIDTRIVRGPESVHVVGPGYEMFGEDWRYDDADKTIVVQRNVVVTFDDSVGNILK